MKHLIGLFILLALLLVSSGYTQQRQLTLENSRSEERAALVIGNSNYLTAPLKNPVNDAQDVAQALRGLGFDVIYRENLNQNDMKRAIREFGEKIRGGGIGLFYYAGHGVAVKGVNYLVPVDAKVESEEEVEYECVDAGFMLAQMDSARNRMNIVILDACRNNPFARSFRSASRGLAQMDAPSGTLIAYSTAPGSVASDGNSRNGLYTQELLKNLRTPGVGIEEIFKRVRISVRNLTQGKQTPWESSSLTGDFYFVFADQVVISTSRQADAANSTATTDMGTYIPSLNATVAGVRFFESDVDIPINNQRQYKTRFPKAETRYVSWQLDLVCPASSTRKDFKIYAVYYRPDGSVLTAQELNTYIESGWTSSNHANGYGNRSAGIAYGAGRYKVDLLIEGRKVASGSFEIY